MHLTKRGIIYFHIRFSASAIALCVFFHFNDIQVRHLSRWHLYMMNWKRGAWLSNDCTLRGLQGGGTFSTSHISQAAVSIHFYKSRKKHLCGHLRGLAKRVLSAVLFRPWLLQVAPNIINVIKNVHLCVWGDCESCTSSITAFFLTDLGTARLAPLGLAVGFSMSPPILDGPQGDLVTPVQGTLNITCRYDSCLFSGFIFEWFYW